MLKTKKMAVLLASALLLQACAATTATKPTDMSYDMYRVKSGESLQSIAAREYGSKSDWVHIYDLNKDTIKNPHMIYPNQMIKLPETVKKN
ncbi:MAG: LysM peptidoglycan-binding domain-containing protein [Alphaproteobacteria bacterium]|jgi:nucleoid-associated protein YgaU|nr:LysM peptidoglycan-binding domain-containing protein [Alphaproteobacteria bacterium]